MHAKCPEHGWQAGRQRACHLDVKVSLGDRTCDNAASGGYGAEQSIKISWSEKEVSVNRPTVTIRQI
jgi:hypothetical protein